MKKLFWKLPANTTSNSNLYKTYFLKFRKALFNEIKFVTIQINITFVEYFWIGNTLISKDTTTSFFKYPNDWMIIKLSGESVHNFFIFLDTHFDYNTSDIENMIKDNGVIIKEIEFQYRIIQEEQYKFIYNHKSASHHFF